MPFKLTNSFTTFQKYLNKTLIKYLNQFCSAYINNILIYLEDLAKYNIYILLVLEQLKAAKL